jgi:hypothetical protein
VKMVKRILVLFHLLSVCAFRGRKLLNGICEGGDNIVKFIYRKVAEVAIFTPRNFVFCQCQRIIDLLQDCYFVQRQWVITRETKTNYTPGLPSGTDLICRRKVADAQTPSPGFLRRLDHWESEAKGQRTYYVEGFGLIGEADLGHFLPNFSQYITMAGEEQWQDMRRHL